MTTAELEALPVSFGLETACKALGIGRNQGYALRNRGQFPAPVRKLCGRYRVSKYDLLAYLGAPGYAVDGAGTEAAGVSLRPVQGGAA